MPCYGRPTRTVRMLRCLAAQTMTNFELVLIGDACPIFQTLIESSWFKEWKYEFKRRGNHLFYMNLAKNRGGHGADAVNIAIGIARGKYFCWANNDDMLQPEHMQFYYFSISKYEKVGLCSYFNSRPDFVYNQTLINSDDGFSIRYPELKFGSCGHSELVVNTKFLQKMPAHEPVYGQDWKLIDNMQRAGKGFRGDILFPTYMVMSTPRYQEQGID